MNYLLIFFALPISIIILSSVFVRILKSPISIAATTFAIFFIVTFAIFDASFLIATFIYTILSFISAVLTKLIVCYITNQSSQGINLSENTAASGLNEKTQDTINIGTRNNICTFNQR